MTRSEAYNCIYDTEPDTVAHKVFFAFNMSQVEEGMAECGYKDFSEIVHAGSGLYGSMTAIKSFLGEYDDMVKRVAEECNPQKVYDYEFDNHECDYTCTDYEAISMIIEIFGKDKARGIKRRRATVSIDDIERNKMEYDK